MKFTKLFITNHGRRQMTSKGYTNVQVHDAFNSPEEVYPNGKYPGQWRICGNGLCLVGEPGKRNSEEFYMVTIYADKILTAPRADQMNTEEGKRYAEYFHSGLLTSDRKY